ncbi:hypothetical protein D9M68_651750 [compost metagenome]
MAHRREGAAQVDADHGVEILDVHVHERLVAQDAGVVDQHVEPAERGDRGLDQPLGTLPVGHVVGVGHGLAAHRADLGHHFLRGAVHGARAVGPGAQVVDDHLRALAREFQCVFAAEAAAGAGDDDHAVLAELLHLHSFRFAGIDVPDRAVRSGSRLTGAVACIDDAKPKAASH